MVNRGYHKYVGNYGAGGYPMKCPMGRCTPPIGTFHKDQILRDEGKVCTISFDRPVNYLCDAWHVFPPKYEAWTHFNRP